MSGWQTLMAGFGAGLAVTLLYTAWHERRIGPDEPGVAANLRTTARNESMLASRLLMTAFQPIVTLGTRNTVGVEALTRFVADPSATPDVWFADTASVGPGTALTGLRRLGVRFAIDDTGAGFASFRHTPQLRPDLIKLDRAIIIAVDTDPARRAAVASAASIGAG